MSNKHIGNVLSIIASQVDKIKNPRGVVRFPFLRGCVNFSNQRGVTPPQPQKNFRLRLMLFLTVAFSLKTML